MSPRLAIAMTALGAVLAGCQSQGTSPPAAAAAAPTPEPVEAQRLGTTNLRQMSCQQAIDDKVMFDAVMIWADGYIHGVRRTAATSQRELTSHKNDFMRECGRTPTASVHAIVLRIAPRVAIATPAARPAAAPATPAAQPPSGQRPAPAQPAR